MKIEYDDICAVMETATLLQVVRDAQLIPTDKERIESIRRRVQKVYLLLLYYHSRGQMSFDQLVKRGLDDTCEMAKVIAAKYEASNRTPSPPSDHS